MKLHASAAGSEDKAEILGSTVIGGTLSTLFTDQRTDKRTVLVGDANNTGSLAVGKLENIRVFADPSWESGKEAAQVAVKELASSATVQAGQNSIVALGTMNHAEAVQAVADSGFVVANAEAEGAAKNAVNSVVYVTGTSTTDQTTGAVTYSQVAGGVLADNATKANTNFNGVTISKNSSSCLMLPISTRPANKLCSAKALPSKMAPSFTSAISPTVRRSSSLVKLSPAATTALLPPSSLTAIC